MMPRTLFVANRRPGARRPPAMRGALAPRAIRGRAPSGGAYRLGPSLHLLPTSKKASLLGISLQLINHTPWPLAAAGICRRLWTWGRADEGLF